MAVTTIATQPNDHGMTNEIKQLKPGFFGWLLLLPLLFFATHGYFSFQGDGNQDAVTSRATVSVATTHEHGMLGAVILPALTYGIILCALLFNLKGVTQVALQQPLLTFLALLTIFSAAWSQNPLRSIYSGGFYLVGTLFAYYLVLRFQPEEIMKFVMRVGVAVCLLGAMMVFIFPKYGVNNSDPRAMGAWVGIFVDRVSSAKCSVYLLSPALIFMAGRSRWRNMVYAAMLLTFIVMAKAVTALGVTFAFVSIMTGVQLARRLERGTALLFGSVVGMVCLLLVFAGDTMLGSLLGLFGRNMTLTGRTEIWAILLNSIMKHPLLGYGYYAFWQGMTGESANVIHAAHWFFGYAHNGLLEIVLQLGVIGAVVFLATFIIACKNALYCFKYGRTPGIEWYFSLLTLALLYNIDEETVMWPNDLMSILYVVACCGLATEAKRIRLERNSLYLEPARSAVAWQRPAAA
jgi:exopolysaccharide production protein ExoQ